MVERNLNCGSIQNRYESFGILQKSSNMASLESNEGDSFAIVFCVVVS
jgi:hypothetical protein